MKKTQRKPVIHIGKTKKEISIAAGELGARLIRKAIKEKGRANIIVATGASQLDMLQTLTTAKNIDWTKVTAFHLDEYIGLPITHPASFRKYLWERFVSQLPLPLAAFHYLNPEKNPVAECRRVSEIIRKHPVDVCFAGFGENGHLAFNDPPADFKTAEPYIVVDLDEACRKQQLGEGWFKTLAQVPKQAISMSVKQIMKSKAIVCTVPGKVKAQAAKDCLNGKITPQHPASILQRHSFVRYFLDEDAASLLGK
ncbi:MAG: glucosamine-6-phosphate deaminase [Kiritimatiellales bacterium]